LSNCQADLKVGLYEIVVSRYEVAVALYEKGVGLCKKRFALYEWARSFTMAARARSQANLADLKVGLYEMAADVYRLAGSLAVAAHVRSHWINRRLGLGLSFARAMLSALVTRGSALTLRPTSHGRRSLIPFGCGVAAGAVVTLFLPAQSIPGATMPSPGSARSQPASSARNVTATTLAMRQGSPSVQRPVNSRSVRTVITQTMTVAGRREPDQTFAVSPSRSPSPRIAPSARRAASPKLTGYRGSLAVSSAPKGARVLINGVPVGTTPLLLKDVPVGSRVVRLELDGYERWSSAVRVVANQRVRTAADLQRSISNN
jgi:hypothetical protein